MQDEAPFTLSLLSLFSRTLPLPRAVIEAATGIFRLYVAGGKPPYCKYAPLQSQNNLRSLYSAYIRWVCRTHASAFHISRFRDRSSLAGYADL